MFSCISIVFSLFPLLYPMFPASILVVQLQLQKGALLQNFNHLAPCILPRVSGHPQSAQESSEMRSLHQRVRETKKFLCLSSSRLCLKGWGSSSLELLQVCSCADPGSSQLGTPVAKRCCRGFLEVYRVSLHAVLHETILETNCLYFKDLG